MAFNSSDFDEDDDFLNDSFDDSSFQTRFLDYRFEEAAGMVVRTQKASSSDLQRKLNIGYAQAERILDQLEAAGIIGPKNGGHPRQVLINDPGTLETIIRQAREKELLGYYNDFPNHHDAEEDKRIETTINEVENNNLEEHFSTYATYVVLSQSASTSDFKKRFHTGAARTERIMEQLESVGVVGAKDESGQRQVLFSDLDELMPVLDAIAPIHHPSEDYDKEEEARREEEERHRAEEEKRKKEAEKRLQEEEAKRREEERVEAEKKAEQERIEAEQAPLLEAPAKIFIYHLKQLLRATHSFKEVQSQGGYAIHVQAIEKAYEQTVNDNDYKSLLMLRGDNNVPISTEKIAALLVREEIFITNPQAGTDIPYYMPIMTTEQAQGVIDGTIKINDVVADNPPLKMANVRQNTSKVKVAKESPKRPVANNIASTSSSEFATNTSGTINPFRFFALVYLIVIILILLPTFLLIIPIWWPIAWILEQIFPGHNFMPIRKIFASVANLVSRMLHGL